MRVTNNMMTNMMLHNLNRNMYSMSRLQEQGSDGKRIHRPSDDAIGISKILKFKSDLSELNQYESNIKDVLSWYQVSESAIVDISSAVDRMRELAVQASNDATQSPDDLKKIMAEVKELKSHIVSAGNFSYAGKYVFSGYQNDKPLLKTEIVNGEEVVSYNVDVTDGDVARPQKMMYAVGEAEQIQVSTSGLELFGVEDANSKKYSFSADFETTADFSTDNIELKLGNDTYTIKTTKTNEDGTIQAIPLNTKDSIEIAFKNAKNKRGESLGSLLNVSFEEPTAPSTKGKIVLEEKAFTNLPISIDPLAGKIENPSAAFKYNKNVYGEMFTDSSGGEFEEGIHVLHARFDPTMNYTSDTLDISLGGINYEVDEQLLDGRTNPIDKSLILERYRKAPAEAPNSGKLEDVADIYFDKHNNLVIKAKDFKKNKLELDLTGTTVDASNPLKIEVNGKEYTVTDASSDLTIGAAINSSGDPLSDVLDINLSGSDLTLESKNFDNKKIEINALKESEHHNMKYSFQTRDTTMSSASTGIKFSNSGKGISAKKAQLIGKFSIDGADSDYRNSDMVYTIDGKDFKVDTSQLTGKGFTLKREKVLEKIRNAEDNLGDKLSNHADVFFNQDGDLVVKHKKYGSTGTDISLSVSKKASYTGAYTHPGYSAVYHGGEDATEARIDYGHFKFDDTYVQANENKLKSTPIYIVYNGERKEISIDKDATFNTVDGYKANLQDAIDKALGENKVKVSVNTGGTPSKSSISFETISSPNGVRPQLELEPVVTKKSSLIGEIDRFIEALGSNDHFAIDNFLGNIDDHLNRILSVRSDIGAKTNRMELALERTKDNVLTFTKSLSKVEDVDMAETIMKLKNYENVYRASLSMGSKIIQPSLVDFIR